MPHSIFNCSGTAMEECRCERRVKLTRCGCRSVEGRQQNIQTIDLWPFWLFQQGTSPSICVFVEKFYDVGAHPSPIILQSHSYLWKMKKSEYLQTPLELDSFDPQQHSIQHSEIRPSETKIHERVGESGRHHHILRRISPFENPIVERIDRHLSLKSTARPI